jgi:tetratricopeptide (TPR) repeat protein
MKDNCKGALPYYEDYLSQAEPNLVILKEYGDVNFCAKRYNMALEIYNSVLDEEYDYDVRLERAKVFYAIGDSLKAANEFEELVEEDSLNFEANLYLGDSYAKLEKYDLAEEKYDSLLTWDLDSTQISMVEQRRSWIPVTGLRGLVETFPNYIGFGPSASYYKDNLGFKFSNIGARLDLGVNIFLTVGVSFFRTTIMNTELSRDFTSFKGHLTFRLLENMTGGFGFGPINSSGETIQRETELSLRYEEEDKYYIYTMLKSSDAGVLLYSADLVDIRMGAKIFTLDAKIFDFKGFMFLTHYQYVSVEENHEDYGNNKGNDFQLRIGSKISDRWTLGYEYYLSNYRYDSDYYYSPQYFQSHSIWFDVDFSEPDVYELFLKGKIGTIPANGLMTIEGRAEAAYEISEGIRLNANISAGSTAREDQQYSYLSGQISMYLNL